MSILKNNVLVSLLRAGIFGICALLHFRCSPHFIHIFEMILLQFQHLIQHLYPEAGPRLYVMYSTQFLNKSLATAWDKSFSLILLKVNQKVIIENYPKQFYM